MILRLALLSSLVSVSPLMAQTPVIDSQPVSPTPPTTAAEQVAPTAEATSDSAQIEPNVFDSVFQIEVATQNPDYLTPWNSGGFAGGRGTGFLIGPNQILTNAHVVSNARRILVTQRNSARKLPATIKFIAHDCDLALLSLDDPSPLADAPILPIGGMPALDSEVRAIGYPIGGDRLSVSRGVVSRIDFRPYAHSRTDSHLIIQVDAAINPGNSGGPALQDGKVIGVAFQGLTQADNTGYIIPTPVIERFLADIKDGRYDNYMDIGMESFPLFNPAMRQALGLPDDDRGVLVTSVVPEGPADGILKNGDILLSIEGKTIDSAGNINVDGENLILNEIVERKFEGDTVAVEFLRDGKKQAGEIILKPLPGDRITSVLWGERPKYIFYSGLVFQTLSLNSMSAHRMQDVTIRALVSDYLNEGIFKQREEIVILTRIESDELTANITGFTGSVLNTINGTPVKNLAQAYELLYETEQPEFTVFEFENRPRPITIPSAKVESTNERLMKINNIPTTHFLGE